MIVVARYEKGSSVQAKYSEKKEDADHHAILFGKEVIDGKHPNASVDNLY